MKFKFPVAVLILLLLGIYWVWWIPGSRVATDFSLLSHTLLKSKLNFPQTWTTVGAEGLGEPTVFYLWSWPFNLMFGILANLGLSYEILQRVIVIIPFLLIGTLGIWKVANHFNLSSYGKFISTLFYLTNTYIILIIDGGQLSISLAYVLLPIGFLALEHATAGSLKKKVLAGLLISSIGFFDFRFIYILLLLSIIRFIHEFLYLNPKEWTKWTFNWFKSGLIVTLVIIGLNAYWILVIINAPPSINFYNYLTQTSSTGFISLGHALFLLSPHWYKNIFGNLSQLKFEFILIPLLVFLAPIVRPKSRTVSFWMMVAVISVFLAKGNYDPIGGFYPWLYSHIPGFSLFRDSSKFFFLVALSYSLLIGITVDELIKRIKRDNIKKILFTSLVIYLVFLIRPVWMGKMTGTFSRPSMQIEYSKLNKFIQSDTQESNVFWIPTISPLTELDSNHPAVEAVRLVQKRPFSQANIGTYERFNFLREASYMGEIFNVANIGYVVYPPLDLRRADPHPDNIRYYNTFLSQLSNLPWLSKVENFAIPIFKVKQHQETLFITPNVWWIIGSDNSYKESTKSAKLSLSKNALIFAEEFSGLGNRLDELPFAKIILNNKTLTDFAASFIKNESLIFPAKQLGFDPDATSGWWKREAVDIVWWRSFLQEKYNIDNQDFDLGGGWAVGEGSLKFKVKSEKLKKGQVLLVRVLESSRSGNLKFYQDNQVIGEVSTKVDGDANVRWFEVGKLNSAYELRIMSEGDINVINSLAILSDAEWVYHKKIAKDLEDSGRIVDFKEGNVEENIASLVFRQITPTKYSIDISNLKIPTFLVFAQNFDTNWKLNNRSPFPVYSLLNGFNIEKDGQYELIFEPQKYLSIGFVVSVITLLTSLLLLLV